MDVDGPAVGAAGRSVPRWALPAELAYPDRRRPRRTARDWAADLALFGFAVLMWLSGREELDPIDPGYAELVPEWMIAVDPWVGAAACLALWWRRRFPLALAIVMVPALTVSGTAFGAVIVSVLTLAIHRGPLPAAIIVALQWLQTLPFTQQYQPGAMSPLEYAIVVLLAFGAPLGWGIAIRARRQLTIGLRRDAEREREAHEQRLVDARRAERTRIAREMHDVLAHRISLVSVHAGALAYRTVQARQGAGDPLADDEVLEAVTVIRDNAHLALTELGEVLTVLRSEAESDEGRDSPQPRLADLGRLVREATAAGQRVRLTVSLPNGAAPRAQEQRTAYRVVQEGLTNARKHAPTARVRVTVAGAPGEQLVVGVENPLPSGVAGGQIPGAGRGLAGLSERVALDGGRLEHGPAGGDFRLVATLPWRT